MSELKPGWRRLKFNEMVTSAGATRKARGWSAAAAGVERYVSLEHLDPNSPTIRRWGSPEDVGENSDLRPFEAGDVILARRGIEQRKVGFATFDGVASGHALVFRARPGVVLPEFLPFFLLSDAFMERVEQFSAGSLSKTVNLSTLLRLEFALPPLEEQRRMCELLAASIESVHTLEKLASAADMVAQAAVDTCVANNSSGQLGNAAVLVTSGSRGWAQHYAESGDLFLRVTNLRPHSIRLDMLDKKFVRPPEGAEGSRTLVRFGDVLVAITGEYLGMIGLVTEDMGRAYVNQHVAIVRLDSRLADPCFAAFSLTSSVAQQSVWSRNDGGTKPGMTLGQVRSLPIPAISLDEQRAWARRFERIEQQRDNSRARITSARQMFHAFLNSELS